MKIHTEWSNILNHANLRDSGLEIAIIEFTHCSNMGAMDMESSSKTPMSFAVDKKGNQPLFLFSNCVQKQH